MKRAGREQHRRLCTCGLQLVSEARGQAHHRKDVSPKRWRALQAPRSLGPGDVEKSGSPPLGQSRSGAARLKERVAANNPAPTAQTDYNYGVGDTSRGLPRRRVGVLGREGSTWRPYGGRRRQRARPRTSRRPSSSSATTTARGATATRPSPPRPPTRQASVFAAIVQARRLLTVLVINKDLRARSTPRSKSPAGNGGNWRRARTPRPRSLPSMAATRRSARCPRPASPTIK